MKLFFTILFLLFSLNTYSQSFKIGGDKILHFKAIYTISYTTYQYLQPKIGKHKAKRYSIIASLGIGSSQEIIDERYRKGWEAGDMYANVGGIILFRFDLTKKH